MRLSSTAIPSFDVIKVPSPYKIGNDTPTLQLVSHYSAERHNLQKKSAAPCRKLRSMRVEWLPCFSAENTSENDTHDDRHTKGNGIQERHTCRYAIGHVVNTSKHIPIGIRHESAQGIQQKNGESNKQITELFHDDSFLRLARLFVFKRKITQVSNPANLSIQYVLRM